jgi:hypothetical protein
MGGRLACQEGDERVQPRAEGTVLRPFVTIGGPTLALSVRRPIGPDEVREIVGLTDDVYRNHWISYAYFDISRQLSEYIGDNASWCTFSTWSSRMIGEYLRVDEPNPSIEQWLRDHPVPVRAIRGLLRRFGFWIRTRQRGAMPRALALGNRLVFEEIGLAVARLIEQLEGSRAYDEDELRQLESALEATGDGPLFPPGDPEQLREALRCYYRARWENRPNEKAELVLLANTLLGAYEQSRLQPIVEAALSPFARRLHEFERETLDALTKVLPSDRATLRPYARPWALQDESPVLRWIAAAYAQLLTRFIILLQLPQDGPGMEAFHIGVGLPEPGPDQPLYPRPLDQLRDGRLTSVLSRYDKSDGTARGCRAENWASFGDRMSYIVNVFRARQTSAALYESLGAIDFLPLSLSDEVLDRLRGLGDSEADERVRRFVADTGLDPRQFLGVLVEYGVGAEEMKRGFEATDAVSTVHGAKVDSCYAEDLVSLPAWADEDQLRQGQEFFRDFGLEIASGLFSAALPMSYTATRGAQVLTRTAELVSNPERRIAETGQMLLDVMAAKDASLPPLSGDTFAYKAARGVRLFHAAVRYWILNDPATKWDVERLGVPINQEDLLGTLAAFTVVVVESLEKMGVSVDDEERDAYLHLWLVVGHLMGIDYELLLPRDFPADEQPLVYGDVRRLRDEILRRNAGESREGPILMSALADAMARSMPPPLKTLPRALTRHLIGTEYADLLDVSSTRWMDFAVSAMRPVALALTPLTRVGPFGKLADSATRKMFGFWIQTWRGERPRWRFEWARERWRIEQAGAVEALSTTAPYPS